MLFFLKFQMIIDLPRSVSAYALNSATMQTGVKIAKDFGLPAERDQEVDELFGNLLTRSVVVADVPKEIVARFSFDETRAHECAVRIWKELCAPIAWYFENFSALMAAEKIDVSGVTQIPQPTITIEAAVADIMALSSDMPGNIKRKLTTFIRSTLEGDTFDADAVRQKISQSVSEGGFGINAKTAWKMTLKLRDYLGEYQFGAEIFKKVIEPAMSELQPREADEVAALGSAAQAVVDNFLSVQQSALVEAVLAAESMSGATTDMQTRWRSIVQSRVNGVRDAAQTRALILSPATQGGFDLPAGDAKRLADLLEKTASGFEQKRNEFSVTEKIASVMNATAGLAEDPDKKQKDAQKELNERFVGMFGKDVVAKMKQESHREIQTHAAAHPEENKTEMMLSVAKQHVVAVSSNERSAFFTGESARDAGAISAGAGVKGNASSVMLAPPKYAPKIPDKLKNLIDADTPATAFLKKSGPALAALAPKHSDIRAPQRLLGPIDELAFMTLIDWRRLSPDPAVRIQKIRSKIEVIGEDGAMEKIRAVQAFQQSEPARIYRELLRESLQKHENTEALISERESAHTPVLDTIEFEVVKAFLAEIRFA